MEANICCESPKAIVREARYALLEFVESLREIYAH